MTVPASILIYGLDPTLLRTRRLLLENAGFRVETAPDADFVAKVLNHQSVDLSILCHTLSREECEAVMAKVHSIRPKAKIVLLEITEDERHVSHNDSVVNVFDGPEKLVETVKMLLHR